VNTPAHSASVCTPTAPPSPRPTCHCGGDMTRWEEWRDERRGRDLVVYRCPRCGKRAFCPARSVSARDAGVDHVDHAAHAHG
jgi:hypothetical protein